MPNKEVISTQNDVERLEIREQTKSKSEAKWKYKVRCVYTGMLVSESTLREGYVSERRWCVGQVWAWWCVCAPVGDVRCVSACLQVGSAVKVFEGLVVHVASMELPSEGLAWAHLGLRAWTALPFVACPGSSSHSLELGSIRGQVLWAGPVGLQWVPR